VRPSQGLDDHAHIPTLELLPKSLPVIASPTAAEVATKLGFTQVVSLAPGKTWIQGAPYRRAPTHPAVGGSVCGQLPLTTADPVG
jgi:hypothetical protein